MNPQLAELLASWSLRRDEDPSPQIASLLEQAQGLGLFRRDHQRRAPGGAVPSGRRGGYAATGAGAADHGGGPRCRSGLLHRRARAVLGTGTWVPRDGRGHDGRVPRRGSAADGVVRARRRVEFVCSDANAIPLPDESFTVAWSQGSFPSDLSWLSEMHRLLAPGGRVGFTGTIRPSAAGDPGLLSLEETVRAWLRISAFAHYSAMT